jgi:hypothetical protein
MSEIHPDLVPYFADLPSASYINVNDPILRDVIFEVFEGVCFYTGQLINKDKMVIEHIVPTAKGGPNNVFNYVLSNKSVNNHKSNKLDLACVIPVLYLVKISYAPKVLSEYLKIVHTKQNEKTKKIYIKPPKKIYISMEDASFIELKDGGCFGKTDIISCLNAWDDFLLNCIKKSGKKSHVQWDKKYNHVEFKFYGKFDKISCRRFLNDHWICLWNGQGGRNLTQSMSGNETWLEIGGIDKRVFQWLYGENVLINTSTYTYAIYKSIVENNEGRLLINKNLTPLPPLLPYIQYKRGFSGTSRRVK